METDTQAESRSQKIRRILVHEMFEFCFNFAFLTVFLVAFSWYRRLILAAYHIHYFAYWAPVIEAAILAKVIMIGDAMNLGRRRFQTRPLGVTALYRSLLFSVLVLLFSFLEHIVGALLHGKPASEGLAEIANKGIDEILAWFIVVLVAFLPFFAIKELEVVFGVGRIRGLLFRKRDAADAPSHSHQH